MTDVSVGVSFGRLASGAMGDPLLALKRKLEVANPIFRRSSVSALLSKAADDQKSAADAFQLCLTYPSQVGSNSPDSLMDTRICVKPLDVPESVHEPASHAK